MATTGVKLIDLVPARELVFEYTSATTCQGKLVITNTHDTDIAFKVKSTVPKAYVVNPSNDLLEKGKSVEIQILLQPGHQPGNRLKSRLCFNPAQGFKEDRPRSHRFLVQAALPATPGSNLSKTGWAALRKVGAGVKKRFYLQEKTKHLGLA